MDAERGMCSGDNPNPPVPWELKNLLSCACGQRKHLVMAAEGDSMQVKAFTWASFHYWYWQVQHLHGAKRQALF